MPLVAEIGSQLTDAALPYSLTLAGLSLIPTFTPYESIKVHEAGPGGVSTMDFEVWDPSGTLSIADGTEVRFNDEDIESLVFAGRVDGWSSRPAFATGRILNVSCVGPEAWLDWQFVAADYFVAFSFTDPAGEVLNILAGSGAPGPVVAVPDSIGLNSFIGGGVSLSPHGGAESYTPFTITAGTSFRAACEAILLNSLDPTRPVPSSVTVDFYYGLRVWANHAVSPIGPDLEPYDYTTLTVADTVAGSTASASISYEVEPGDVVHDVYIDGFDASSSGWFGDGSGVRGRQMFIQDDTITTAAAALLRATQALAEASESVRGTVTIEKYTPAATATAAPPIMSYVHAGSLLDLTDDPAGATGIYRIYSIDKTFNKDGTQNWSVAFGGHRPSAIRLTRKLTRATSVA